MEKWWKMFQTTNQLSFFLQPPYKIWSESIGNILSASGNHRFFHVFIPNRVWHWHHSNNHFQNHGAASLPVLLWRPYPADDPKKREHLLLVSVFKNSEAVGSGRATELLYRLVIIDWYSHASTSNAWFNQFHLLFVGWIHLFFAGIFPTTSLPSGPKPSEGGSALSRLHHPPQPRDFRLYGTQKKVLEPVALSTIEKLSVGWSTNHMYIIYIL